MNRLTVLLLFILLLSLTTGCIYGGNTAAGPAASASEQGLKLTPAEQEIYTKLQKDLDKQHLKGIEPISVAKLYVQASLDKNYDVVYALLTDKQGHVQWTKEEDRQIPEADRGTTEQILRTFRNIETGRFVQTSDFEGYIEYTPNKEEAVKSGFQMIKKDGIWNVAFQPIQ